MIITQFQIDLDTPTGTMRCHGVRPLIDRPFPAVIFYSEIFQVTEPIARTAAYLAGHGYVVIVPEVFHELNEIGTVLAYDDAGKEKGNSDKFTKPLTSHDTDTQAIIDWVDQQPFCKGAIGSFGVCLGGHLACRAAVNPRIQGAACLYATDIHSSTIPAGDGPSTLNLLGDIQGEVLFVWGKQDPHVPLEGRKMLYNILHDAGTTHTWHELNGQHAFMRDEGQRYDPELATLCHRLILDLFHRSLC